MYYQFQTPKTAISSASSRIGCFVLFCLWLVHVPAQALTLQQALEEAVATHPKIRAKHADIRAARAELNGAEWQRYPALSISGSTDANGDPVTIARVQQPLWMWGRSDATEAASTARLKAAEADLLATQNEVMVNTGQAFMELLRVRAKLAAAERNIAEHQRLQDMIQRRVAQEITPVTDATHAISRLQQALLEKTQFETQSANAVANLVQLIGRPVQASEVIEPGLDTRALGTLDEWQQEASQVSPALARAEAEAEAARATVKVRQASALPQLVARYDHYMGGRSSVNSKVIVALEYQSGAGLSSLSSIDASRERLSTATSNLDTTRMELMQRIRTDWNEATSLSAQIAQMGSVAQAATDVAESYSRQYATGRKSWTEVLNAQREVIQSLYALADAQSAAALARLRLQINTGRLQVNTAPPAPARP
jgi:adhesin transport system outer membrane protein